MLNLVIKVLTSQQQENMFTSWFRHICLIPAVSAYPDCGVRELTTSCSNVKT
uniref:Uncharacterized protein n=1 Tax=Arion vulgaris TaxID=1028688 RepID=A0A0B7BGP7_9EUPU